MTLDDLRSREVVVGSTGDTFDRIYVRLYDIEQSSRIIRQALTRMPGGPINVADPTNTAARDLQADALEQLGYQAESATFRNAYLQGAQELRNGTLPRGPGRRGGVLQGGRSTLRGWREPR